MELHLLPQLSKYGNKQLHVTVPEGPVQISSPRTMCKASTVWETHEATHTVYYAWCASNDKLSSYNRLHIKPQITRQVNS